MKISIKTQKGKSINLEVEDSFGPIDIKIHGEAICEVILCLESDSAPFADVLAYVSERPYDLCIYNLPILALDASQVPAQIRSSNHTHSNTYILNNTCIKHEMEVQNT
ncbi:hypothetical protein F2Q70_00042932 [Brassica cretica]|uniref:Uncharacterized protein n=1 Tax=Brassica cretica TaxID=69181 RepID=A0A8S9LS38_BRACR|nr:hypothetical protein F2Q70_00042932 [Brassica cretica]KAF2609332.1 hypothetical protein F2Q68_00043735 [Brassica cretica]